MKRKIQSLIADKEIDTSAHYLLSQELEFEYAKSVLTFAMAFIGGIVTLKTALGIDHPIENGFGLAIVAAIFSALFALDSQQGIIKDLRCGRYPSPLRRMYRRVAGPAMLGIAIAFAIKYFDVSVP